MSFYAPRTDFTSNPIDWDDVKYWLRLDDDAERTNALSIAGDALAWAEDYTASTLVQRTRTVWHYGDQQTYQDAGVWQPCWGTLLELPNGPVVDTSIVATDANNATVGHTVYRSGTLCGVRLTGAAVYPVKVTYTAGYSALPNAVRRAVLMATDAMYFDHNSPDLSGASAVLTKWSYRKWIA